MPESENNLGALGFRAHSGWAAMVVLAGPVSSPTVLDRRRIEICDAKAAGSRQPYHAAKELSLQEAEKLIAACAKSSIALAAAAVRAAIQEAEKRQCRILAGGILAGSRRPLPPLEKILAAHPLLHTAEGELFRNVIAEACRQCEIPTVRITEKELMPRLRQLVSLTEEAVEQHLVRLGKAIGSPWRQDEKRASLAAWIALAEAAHSGRALHKDGAHRAHVK